VTVTAGSAPGATLTVTGAAGGGNSAQSTVRPNSLDGGGTQSTTTRVSEAARGEVDLYLGAVAMAWAVAGALGMLVFAL
jgi:hypothetical protein